MSGLSGGSIDGIEIDGGDSAAVYIYLDAYDASAVATVGVSAVLPVVFQLPPVGVSDIFHVAPDMGVWTVAPDAAPFIVPPGRKQ